MTIVVIALSIALPMKENIQDFKDGTQAGHESYSPGMSAPSALCHLKIAPVAAPDSLYNEALGQTVSYRMNSVDTFAKVPFWAHLFTPFFLIAAIAYLLGFIALVKLLIAVSKKQVFTEKNVHYLRFFAYTQAALYVVHWLQVTVDAYYGAQQVSIPGYEVVGSLGTGTDWTLVMIVILFAEIFAVGVKIKEEQDLTV